MKSKSIITNNLIAAGLILIVISVFSVLTLIFNFYFAVLAVVALLILAPILFKNISIDKRKKITENVFVIITASSALILFLFVVYLLVQIFWVAKPVLTWDFIIKPPAEGLTEGGIFPAIIGTALLVIIMSVVGVPFGTLTAIYLNEYAKSTSRIARFIRFAINTLAGVPAIVFGLFGLGFFIGTIGHTMDAVKHNSRIEELRNIVNTTASPFYKDGKATLNESVRYLKKVDSKEWAEQILILNNLAEGRGPDSEISSKELIQKFEMTKRPEWGQPALIWAALTMALLTLPVVIVSVEEALKAVPYSLREASLALGATKFFTILKVVLPGSITGILTGTILAISRGAGEVAPILFTGAAYYLPELPKSLNSQFMELGYHIYILTTQSTNVEQTLPLQYATTFVLLVLTFALNFSAIFIRSKMRRRQGKME